MSQDEQRAREWAEGTYALLELGDHVRLPNTTVAILETQFKALSTLEYQRGYEAGLEAAAQVADFARLSNVAAAIRALPRKG